MPAQSTNSKAGTMARGRAAWLLAPLLLLCAMAAAIAPAVAQSADGVSVKAIRSHDALAAQVSWSAYAGDDFEYYRFVVCPDGGFVGGTCSGNVFTSDAYYAADEVGPVAFDGLDPHTGYNVILQVWRTGGEPMLRFYAAMPGLPQPTPEPTPEPTREPTPEPTPTPIPAPTPEPTPEPMPTPAPTPEPTPTPTPEPTPSPTPTPTPTPSPTPEPTPTPETVQQQRDGEEEGLVSAQGGQAQSGLSWVTAPPTLLEWTQGVAVNVTLPAATGDPNITYKLSEGGGAKGAQLPPGISWNASTRTLSGTPTKWFSTRVANYYAYASNKSAPSVNIHIRVADTSGNHAPYASIKSSGSQLIGQLWLRYGHCYSGSVTYAPSSGHTQHFYDPEDDTLSFTAGSSKIVGTSINSNGYAVASLRHPPVNWYSFHYTATDPDGLYDAISLQVKHFNCKETLSVQENKPKDTVVGSVGGPNKADGSSFSISGDVATYFDIDSSTGQITVKDGTTLDYETKTSYSGTFRYSVENTTVGGNIQINVNDVRAPNVDRPTLAQNSTNPTTALDVSWTAPTPMTGTTLNDYDVRYRQAGTSTWSTIAHDGTATSDTITGLTAGKGYEVQVRAQIVDEGPGHWSGSSVILYLAENTAANGNVGGKFNVNATDYYPLRFSLGGTDGSKFKLHTDTGYKTAQSAQLQVKSGTNLDYETKKTYSLTLRAVENNLQRNILDVTYSVFIYLTDANDAPQFAAATTTRDVAESAAGGANVGAAVTATDQDGDTLTYSLSGTDAAKFSIGASTGQITLASTTSLDYEAKTSYSVTVGVSDLKTSTFAADTVIDDTIAVTIRVTDVAEAPAAPSAPTVSANSTTPATKLDVSWSAPSTAGKPPLTDYDVQYRLVGASNWTSHSFTGTGTSDTLSGLTNGKSYEVQVRASNDEGTSGWSASGAGITDANAVTRAVAENSPAGTSVGAPVTATSNPNNYTLTHSLSGTDAGSFTIESSSGQIKVKSGTTLNYEAKTSYSVTVTVRAAAAGVQSQSLSPNAPGDYVIPVTINVTDLNEGPQFPGATTTRDIAENSTAGTRIGAAVTATDPEGDALTYSLTGTDAGKFALDATTGYLAVKLNYEPNFEAGSSFTVIVNVTDNKNATNTADATIDDSITVTIRVLDESEPPAKPAAPTMTAHATHSTTTLDVSWTAPNMTGKPAITDYDVEYKRSNTSSWTSHSFTGAGSTTSIDGLLPGTPYDFRVRATNDEGTSDWSDEALGIPHSLPVSRSVAENSAAYAHVGAPVVPPGVPNAYLNLLIFTLAGPDAASFEVDSQGQIGVGGGTALDYESGATAYSVIVLAGGYYMPVNISVSDVNEPPAAPAAPSVSRNTAQPKTKIDVSWTDPDTTGKPPVTDYDVQYRKQGATGWSTIAHDGTSVIAAIDGLAPGATYQVQVRASNDEGAGAWSDSGRATTIANTMTRSVAENSAAGTNVGAAVTATSNPNGYTLTHSMSGTDAGSFTIDSSSGQIKVKTGTALNHEGKTSYSVTVAVKAASAGSQTSTTTQDSSLSPNAPGDYIVPVTISVSDVNEPPAAPDMPTLSRNSASPKTKIDASWTAPDVTGKPAITDYDVQYRVKGTTGWSTIAHDGTATTDSIGGLTPGATYQVQVRASNDEGAGAWSSSAELKTHKNLNPTHSTGTASRSIPENTAAGSNVGAPVTAADPEGDPLTYTLTGTDADKFAVNSSTGQLTVGAATALDYETKTTYSVTVNASDGKDLYGDPDTAIDTTIAVTINVTDVNDAPQFPGATTTRDIAENSAGGTNVGAVITASDDDGDTLTYSLSGTDAASFTLAATTGRLRLADGVSLDHEAKSSYSVSVRVSDLKTSTGAADTAIDDTIAVTVNVTDADEPPAAPGAPSVAQHAPTPKTQLDVDWTAPTMTGKPAITDYDVQYKKSSDSSWTSHSFTGTGTSARITGLTEGTAYDVQVKAKNHEGASAWSASGSATTQDANIHAEFPSATDTRDIAENSAVGASVGAPVTATDTEDHTLAYNLAGGPDAAKFAIDASTGQIKVKSGYAPDYEAKSSYRVTVGVSDRKDTNDNPDTVVDDTIEIVINVLDRDEPPSAPAAPTAAQNAAQPKTQLDVSWTAPDMTGKPAITDYDVQYRATGASDWMTHAFTGAGVSTTISGLVGGTTYEVQVKAKNHEGESAWSASGSAKLQDKNVNPKFKNIGLLGVIRLVAENSAADSKIGAPVAATDTEDDPLTYTLTGTDAAHFTIDASTGQLRVGASVTLDYEAKTNYLVTVQVSDGKDSENQPDTAIDASAFVNINVVDVNEPPAAPAAPTVAKNAAAPKSAIDATWTAPDMTGKPAIDDYDVRYRAVGAPDWSTQPHDGTGTAAALTGLADGTAYEVQVRAINDEGASAWSLPGVAITTANDTNRTVDENTSGGGNVGSPINANTGNYTLVYSLSGADANLFTINSSTGQITVSPGTVLDYESTATYDVVVTITAVPTQGAGAAQGFSAWGMFRAQSLNQQQAGAQSQSQEVNPNAPGQYVLPMQIGLNDIDEPPPAPARPRSPSATTPRPRSSSRGKRPI